VTKPVVLISMGDYNGIGPEISLKAAASPEVNKLCRPVLVGSLDVYAFYARSIRQRVTLREIDPLSMIRRDGPHRIPVISARRFVLPRITPGMPTADAGKWAGDAIAICMRHCLAKNAHAMVTAPVAKSALNAAGYRFPGQTEMLGSLCKSRNASMMMVAEPLRIGLATIHLPVKNIARSITRKAILGKINTIHLSLRKDFRVRSPRIAVLGLNPHAGEEGLLGEEERLVIAPAIRRARSRGIKAYGPFPADGFFGNRAYEQYDAVLAMYHDQGLLPLKVLAFNRGVNYTAGLPIVRTSPDHGTAYDIAGKGVANPSSMIEAIKLAVSISNNRMKGSR